MRRNVVVVTVDALEPQTGQEIVEGGISEDDLAAQALACPVDQPVDPAACVDPLLFRHGTLPAAYMPPAASGPHGRWLALVAVLLIIAFLTITAFGFCITYGALSFA